MVNLVTVTELAKLLGTTHVFLLTPKLSGAQFLCVRSNAGLGQLFAGPM